MTIKLTVLTLTRERLELEFEDQNTTIDAVKEAILARENIPKNNQRLVYKGKQIEEGRTLRDYNIDTGMELHLVLRI